MYRGCVEQRKYIFQLESFQLRPYKHLVRILFFLFVNLYFRILLVDSFSLEISARYNIPRKNYFYLLCSFIFIILLYMYLKRNNPLRMHLFIPRTHSKQVVLEPTLDILSISRLCVFTMNFNNFNTFIFFGTKYSFRKVKIKHYIKSFNVSAWIAVKDG